LTAGLKKNTNEHLDIG